MSYKTYKLYMGIKQHFEQPGYDYFRYNGGVRVQSSEKFYGRRGFPRYFETFNKRYKEGQLLPFFVSNFVSGNKRLEDMVNTGDDIFVAWKHRMQSMTYNFQQELDVMLDNVSHFDELFRLKDADPTILKLFYQSIISPETFIIMDMILNFFPQFDEELDEYQWPANRIICEKYKSFLSVDIEKYKGIIKNRLDIA